MQKKEPLKKWREKNQYKEQNRSIYRRRYLWVEYSRIDSCPTQKVFILVAETKVLSTAWTWKSLMIQKYLIFLQFNKQISPLKYQKMITKFVLEFPKDMISTCFNWSAGKINLQNISFPRWNTLSYQDIWPAHWFYKVNAPLTIFSLSFYPDPGITALKIRSEPLSLNLVAKRGT